MDASISTGSGFFTYLLEKQNIFRNFKNNKARNVIKISLNFLIASIALGIFAKIGFYYNLSLGVLKGAFAILRVKEKGSLRSNNYIKESKMHIIRSVIDLVIVYFKLISALILSIYPDKLKSKIQLIEDSFSK